MAGNIFSLTHSDSIYPNDIAPACERIVLLIRPLSDRKIRLIEATVGFYRNAPSAGVDLPDEDMEYTSTEQAESFDIYLLNNMDGVSDISVESNPNLAVEGGRSEVPQVQVWTGAAGNITGSFGDQSILLSGFIVVNCGIMRWIPINKKATFISGSGAPQFLSFSVSRFTYQVISYPNDVFMYTINARFEF